MKFVAYDVEQHGNNTSTTTFLLVYEQYPSSTTFNPNQIPKHLVTDASNRNRTTLLFLMTFR